MRKNGFLTFCFAFVPGCGQMYQGYMRRGISLLGWFMGVIAVSALLHLGILCILLPVIWAYSFFDTFNLRNLSDEQRAAMGDFFIPCAGWLESLGLERWAKKQNFGKIAGWTLVGVGALVLYGAFWDTISSFLWQYVPFLASWMYRIPSLLVALLVIFVGYKLLRGPRAGDDTKYIEQGGGEDA